MARPWMKSPAAEFVCVNPVGMLACFDPAPKSFWRLRSDAVAESLVAKKISPLVLLIKIDKETGP
ncbi:hypothetical protein [Lihuaxuella thermophila]|uniref:hypothetical protein n=1 Tax=Lihuaxuella thermophila TaxID=1173111 RepID=UPI000B7E62B9|nr:hypothetical protein [Lihuaxuella thermophila]